MAAAHHGGAEEEHGVVEEGAFAFLDGVEAGGDVGELADEELVDLEPVCGVGVGEEVVDHVIHAEVREAERAVVVVEFERGDAGGVGLEAEDEDIGHEAHVFGDVLGDAVGGAGFVWFCQSRAPALEFAALAGVFEALFDIADGVEVFVELVLIVAAEVAAEGRGVVEDGIEDAAVAFACAFLEETVEGESGVDFEGGWGSWRAPRDVGAVEHGVVLVDGGVGFFAAEDETGDLGGAAVVGSDDLVEAGAGADFAAGGEGSAAEEVAGLGAVDVAFEGFGIVEPADEEELAAEVVEGFEDLAEGHGVAFSGGGPFRAVEAIAREEDGDADWGVSSCGGGAGGGCQGFHPWKGDGDTSAAEEGAAGKARTFHGRRIGRAGGAGKIFSAERGGEK